MSSLNASNDLNYPIPFASLQSSGIGISKYKQYLLSTQLLHYLHAQAQVVLSKKNTLKQLSFVKSEVFNGNVIHKHYLS